MTDVIKHTTMKDNKRKTQIGYESFPFDEFADMLTINPSESQKLLRKLATESKTKTEQDD